MSTSKMKQLLSNGGRAYGTMLGLLRSPRWARLLAASGADFVVIDTEHSAYSPYDVADMVSAFAGTGIAPIIRVLAPEARLVTAAMDAGAVGVMVPYCETVEQVRAVLGAVKLRPLKGGLLDQALDGNGLPSDELAEYLHAKNGNGLLIIGIESAPAAANLSVLLEIQGIDAVFVGPHDMSCSLGIPEQYDHPKFQATTAGVLEQCTAHDLPMGVHFADLRLTQEWVRRGVRLVLHSSDVALLPMALTESLGSLREL